MLENVEVLCHSSIKINKEKVIYIDPFKIEKNYNDADIVFITHDHYDHYSEEDIDKVINENTIIIIPEELLTKLLRKGINKNAIITVEPNEKYMVQGIKFETILAYNTNKTFHPKENGWVGYSIIVGLVAVGFHKKIGKEKSFYCAEFVKYVIEKANIDMNLPTIIKPEDFKNVNGLQEIYSGFFRKYNYSKLDVTRILIENLSRYTKKEGIA